MLRKTVFTLVVLASASANAAILQITATSAAHGELGWFVVDDAGLVAYPETFFASRFIDFSFADPLGTAVLTPSNVPADTESTLLAFEGGEWTVIAGNGECLTSSSGDVVWIAGNHYVEIGPRLSTSVFNDVSWTTTVRSPVPPPVPEPTTLAIWGMFGGLGLIAARRRRKRLV